MRPSRQQRATATARNQVRRTSFHTYAGSGAGDGVAAGRSMLAAALGGRRQYRVEGLLNGAAFGGKTMLVAGGGFAVGVSKAALR
jgi:hypothetical protein